MKSFKIEKVNEKNIYMILSTSYISPLDDLIQLEEVLNQEKIQGDIIIDLLLCNGLNNRFFKTSFDGNSIDIFNIDNIEVVDEFIKKISKKFYRDKQQLIDNSILSDAHKYIIKKEVW